MTSIKLVYGHEAHKFPELMDQMFELRARVFDKRLEWEVQVQGDHERDEFDELDPLYALAIDNDRVVGCFRLLQTTGPNMLSDVFSVLVDGPVRSPLIWESTRFCIDTSAFDKRDRRGLSDLTAKMLCSLYEIGMLAGLEFIVTVLDVRMERILRRAGCPMERLGEPKDIGGVQTLAILMPVSEENVAAMHDHNALTESVVPKTEWESALDLVA